MSSVPIGYLFPALLLTWAMLYVVAPKGWPRFPRFLGFYFIVINELPFLGAHLAGWIDVAGMESGRPVLPRRLERVRILHRDDTGTRGRDLLGTPRQHPSSIARWTKGLASGGALSSIRSLPPGYVPRFAASALLGQFAIRRWDVEHVANISYGEAGTYHRLDLYRPRSRLTNAPVLIHFHGGAFVGGKKNHDALPLLYRLASHGWVCISANYRLSPAVTLPEQLSDAKRVIAWVRVHGVEYGANPTAIFVAGNSAGATLAALVALTPTDPTLQPGFESADTSVSAAITLYGAYDWPSTGGTRSASEHEQTGSLELLIKSSPVENRDACTQASPVAQVRKEAPPFFVVHGDRDMTLPVEGARHFAQKLRGISQSPVVYAEPPGWAA